MSTITLPNIRVGSDLQVRVRLKDGGVAIDWSTLQNIKACIYSDAQRALAGRCAFSIDEEDNTLLVCTYAANKPQYLGVNRIVISAKYMGETKTYDKPAFSFVRWTADQEGEEITIDDPDVDVEISVEDVSSSILQEAVDAAFSAADRANEAAAAAEHMVDIHTGPEGKSAYEVAVEEGYTGTEEEWLASLKGDTGETPDITIGTVTTAEPGTPAAATMTGTPEDPVLNLTIPKGAVGATPNFTVGTVTTGAPGSQVVVTITGTPEAPVLNVTIPQGMQGNTGSSVDYPYELVNNLTTNDATKGLSAAQGYVLDGKVSQLEAKVDGFDVLGKESIVLDRGNYLNVASGTWNANYIFTENSTRVGVIIRTEGLHSLSILPKGGYSMYVNTYRGEPGVSTHIASYGYTSAQVDLDITPEIACVTIHVKNSTNTDIFPSNIGDMIEVTGEVETYPNKLQKTIGKNTIPVLYTGKYIITNGSVGTVVEIGRPQTNAAYNCYISPCKEGDVAIINGLGGGAPRLWAIVDKDYKILSNSANNAVCCGLILTIPATAAYIILNDKGGCESYIISSTTLSVLDKNVSSNTGAIQQQETRLEKAEAGLAWDEADGLEMRIFANSTYDSDTGAIANLNGYSRTNKMRYDATKTFTVVPASTTTLVCFWSGDTYQGSLTNAFISPYENTTHIAFCWTVIKDSASYTNVLRKADVVDNLLSNETSAPLSAAQGKELKRLIDSVPGGITIDGSGVTKNAAAYGFLPNKTADENAAALQSCLNGGGLILIDFPGTYEISKTLFVDSNTSLIFAPTVYIKRAVGGDDKVPRYVFVNRGATTRTYNENISIKGLNIIPNESEVTGHERDISASAIAIGLRGLIAMFYVKNFILDGFTVIEHAYNEYSVHLCTFEGAYLRNIHLETFKDGIHFGRGRNFIVERCTFLTNDDALALNAVDYPESNAEAGWIEDGVIQDITFLVKPDGEGYTDKRGVLILTGAWKNWQSGNTYKVYGDYCVNNGRLYQTYAAPSSTTKVSTIPPTHTSGAQTYDDGLRWLVKEWNDVGYSAGVRRVKFKNMFFYRRTTPMFYFSSENSNYMRAFYPGSALYKNEDITFENIHNLGNSTGLAVIQNPCDRLIIKDSNFVGTTALVALSEATDVPSDININFSMIGNYYENVPIIKKNSGDYDVTVNIVGSFRNGHSATFTGIVPTIINNDLDPS